MDFAAFLIAMVRQAEDFCQSPESHLGRLKIEGFRSGLTISMSGREFVKQTATE